MRAHGNALWRMRHGMVLLFVAALLAAGVGPKALGAGKFDYAKIDRTLVEPKYASATPAYRFLAFGPEGKTVMAMVIDESGGAGTGVNTLYVDLNANRDLTEEGERFALPAPHKTKKAPGSPGRDDLVLARLAEWGTTILPARKLEVLDRKLDYTMSIESGFVLVDTRLRDGSWGFPMRVMDDEVPWSTDKAAAPVVRFGGREFTLANDHFARRQAGGNSRAVDTTKPVKTIVPGDNIYLDGTSPFFAGSSPEIRLGKGGGVYCPWSDRNIEAWIESASEPGRPIVKIPFYRSCGGAYWGSILVTTGYPHGDGALVIAMDTRGYLGKVVKRIPLRVENPLYGQGVPDLDATRRLRAEHPGATVMEIYQDAFLGELHIPQYDGARDVYFGDGRGKPFGGSCQNTGNGLSYGTELRYRLDIGGEGRRTLIQFDLSMLAPEVKVSKAVLMLHVVGVNPKADLSCRAIALKKRWSEQIVGVMGGLNGTNGPNPGQGGKKLYPVGDTENWAQPLYKGDADRHPEPVGTVTFKGKGWAAIDVTGAAARWVSGDGPNHGLALETVVERCDYGQKDVWMTSSDYAVDPCLRPRLLLVLEGPVRPVPYEVQTLNPDLPIAIAKARAQKKLVLCNVLSADSLTSRAFETKVLNGVPAVREWLDRHFVEVRVDAASPVGQGVRKRYGVWRFPTAIVISPKPGDADNFVRIEPFDWDAMFGILRSGFEFEQIYTSELDRVLQRGKANAGRLRPTGNEVGGCGI